MTVLTCTKQNIVDHYRRMSADGITDAEIDRGVPDGQLDCTEIIDTAVDHAEQYHAFLKHLTGRAVPWQLDDHNPQTDFDEDLRRRASHALSIITTELKRQGIGAESKVYKRRLAIALYFFCQTPSAQDRSPVFGSDFVQMQRWGLRRFADLLATEGGLGLLDFPQDALLEATAIEALQARQGLCTERSKIIYAIFAQAGLSPFFIHMTAGQTRSAWYQSFGSQRPPPVTPRDEVFGHVAVAIRDGEDNVVYFEPNQFVFDAHYKEYARKISLREMYFFDLDNLIAGQMETSPLAVAKQFIVGALALGESPELAGIYFRQALLLRRERDEVAARETFERALQIDPQHVRARIELCQMLIQMKPSEAKACLDRLPSTSTPAALGFASLAHQEGDPARERAFWLEALNRGADPYHCNLNIAQTYRTEGNLAQAEDFSRRAVALKPTEPEAVVLLASVLLEEGHASKSVNLLESGLAVNGGHVGLLDLMVDVQIKLRQQDFAREYHRHYLYASHDADHFSYAMYERWIDRAENLDLLDSTRTICTTLWDGKGMRSPSLALALLDVFSRIPRLRTKAKEKFPAILPMLGSDETIPPQVYWHAAGIAERIQGWTVLGRYCLEGTTAPAFWVYALHAAWKSSDPSLNRDALKHWDSFLAGLESANPEDLNMGSLEKMESVVDELPRGLRRQREYRERLEKFSLLLHRAYEALKIPPP